MGMREELQLELAEAYDGDLNDAVKSITVFVEAEASYDPEAGESTDAFTEVTGRGMLYDYVARKNDPEDLQTCSKRLLVLTHEVTSLTVRCHVEIGTERYEVMHIGEDPSGATADAYLRRLE